MEGLGAIQRMLESYKQVSKALCGKENASLEEILAVVEQVKTRLAQVERERDAAVKDICLMASNDICNMCARLDEGYIPMPPHCKYANAGECFRWRGVCEENAKEK